MMSTEEQIIAVAEWMNWRPPAVPSGTPIGDCPTWEERQPPEYDKDLNVIYDVEARLHTTGDWPHYVNEVFMLVVGDRKDADLDGLTIWPILHASAPQRLEALCRTLWPERWKA